MFVWSLAKWWIFLGKGPSRGQNITSRAKYLFTSCKQIPGKVYSWFNQSYMFKHLQASFIFPVQVALDQFVLSPGSTTGKKKEKEKKNSVKSNLQALTL